MSASIIPLRATFAQPPRPYRFMTTTEAVLLQRGNIIELWDGRDIHTAFVQSFTEDAVNVTIVSPYSFGLSTNVALEIFNPDLEGRPELPTAHARPPARRAPAGGAGDSKRIMKYAQIDALDGGKITLDRGPWKGAKPHPRSYRPDLPMWSPLRMGYVEVSGSRVMAIGTVTGADAIHKWAARATRSTNPCKETP